MRPARATRCARRSTGWTRASPGSLHQATAGGFSRELLDDDGCFHPEGAVAEMAAVRGIAALCWHQHDRAGVMPAEADLPARCGAADDVRSGEERGCGEIVAGPRR